MRQKLLLLFCFGMFLFANATFAQDISVTGTVKNEKGEAIASASVKVKGTTKGVLTNKDGMFTLKVAEGKALIISAVGYENQSLKATDNMNIILKESQNVAGEDVVIVGYGSGQKISSVVGSVVTVSGRDLENRPVANAFDALQGKVAGLSVLTSSGEPSESSSLSIHGIGSLGASSTPLYVMDGIPIDAGTVISLNPNDLESVTVMKDASSTAIYGSRAANGVVYITTKKGSANSPASINIDQQYGVSNLANKKPFESFMNSKELTDLWVETGYRTQSQVDDLLKQYPNDTKWYQYYYQKNVPTYQTNLSVSGGGNKTTYYVSGNYFSQEGLAYRSAYKRYSVRSNVSSTVTKWMKFGLNFFISYDDRQTNPYGSNSTNRGLAMLAQPFYSPIDPTTGKEYEGIIPGWGRYAPNYLADKNPSIGNNLQIDPSAFIEITPIKNLTLRTQAGMDAYIYTSQSNRLPSYAGSLNNGSTSQSYERGVERTITNTAEYKFVVNTNHHFTLLAGQEYNDYDDNSFSGSSSGQSDDRLILLQNGPNNKSVSSGRTQYVYNSYFGKFDYSYLSKYYFSATIRQDQSSRFGIDNRNANFWSVGVNWKAKKENFLADIDWLTDLSVRANIGTSGNSAIGNYQSLATVGTSQYDGATGWNISAPGNPSLAWESQIQSSFGVNFTLFDRARLDVLYYRRTTKNMLVDVPYPYTSGFASVTSNVGALENNGLDVSIDFDVLKSKDAYITPYVVMNYNKNKVTKLFQGKDYWIIPNTGVSWAIGKPVSFFYPIFDQVNPQTGAPEWYLPDANNPTITQKDPTKVTSDFDPNVLQQNTGLPLNSPFNGGFGLKGGYKGIYVQADFSFYNKKYLINNARYFYENANVFTGFNQSKVVANYWKKPGDIAQFPDYDNYQFMQFDSRLLENASFIRLKVLTVGYRLPTKLLESTRAIKGVNIYFTGRNLLTSTKYLGEDPEVDSNLALGTNPNTKQYTLGVTLNF